MKANELSIGWAMQQENPDAAVRRVFDNVRRYSAKQLRRVLWLAVCLELPLFASATLCVLFGFGLMFLAAYIGG